MDTGQLFESYRPLLFSIAYRMTGSVMDAEDLVQDAFLTFEQKRLEESINNEKAYLCKIVTNKSIDKLRSAAHQREVYIGEWLPEPLVNIKEEPSNIYMEKESISVAYLLLLQQLSESERAIFLLREVFQYSYDEMSRMLDKTPANCRQIFHRSKKSIVGNNFAPSTLNFFDMKRNVEMFTLALQQGNIAQMMELMKSDAIYIADGGGKVLSALKPIYSAQRIVSLFTSIIKQMSPDQKLEFHIVNGNPGIVITNNESVEYVLSFEFEDAKIARVYMVSNPDKLMHLNLNDK
ncbi:RNA polymerase sigma-70 factor [Cytobacillus purgationiresistens]|uniref:RNA polymerase sigma-70 factor (ECF subfamily) n=1 Tax=Cytobacillus purgationiresistens TaxID=863449 RepID=A0ABU0ANK7_9BACI|nr:RNA polymerase sigma-70 factor [Cytobacillus purgationiresistens]MDQ0272768.1 RNA polymerase sigma-70 factor (ECF subfamily) [Cytobacillus purgationiresistens]